MAVMAKTPERPLERGGAARRVGLRLLDQYGIVPVLFIAVFVLFSLASSRFLTVDNMSNIGQQASVLMIVTMGQALFLITRNFDLSVGANIALTSVVASMVMSSTSLAGNTTLAIILGVLAGVGVGVGVGLVNGLLIAGGLSSFIVTLGMTAVAAGIALILSGGSPIQGVPQDFIAPLAFHTILGIPTAVVCTVGLLIGFYVLLNRLVIGRYAFAIGGNQEAARVSGIPVRLTLVKVLVLGSVLTALGGLILTARVASGDPNLGGEYPLLSIAAAVLGGVSLAGGVGRLSGMVIAVVFLQVIQNGLDLLRVSSYVQQIIFGSLLVFALGFDHIRSWLRSKG
ncbi:MAG TPA: ABC transporter permease [Solirubrobacteraceae bacterium]